MAVFVQIPLLFWHDTVVCLSACLLSVTKCIVALMSWGWKLYRCIPKRALPIHFFRHFCCLMYRSVTAHISKKPNRRNFRVCNRHGQRGHMTTPIPDVVFSAVRFYDYIVRRAQYDWPSQLHVRFLSFSSLGLNISALIPSNCPYSTAAPGSTPGVQKIAENTPLLSHSFLPGLPRKEAGNPCRLCQSICRILRIAVDTPLQLCVYVVAYFALYVLIPRT